MNYPEKISTEKKEIRRKIRELKKQLTEFQKQLEANTVFDKIESLPEFKAAKSILLYWSTPDELPTHKIIKKWIDNKQIVLPTVHGDDLVLKSYCSNGALKQGALGIWEPDSQEDYTENIDLVIVPGVAFDQTKNRLGRGKGYYDRYFMNNNSTKIGVAFDCQFLSEVPSSELDVKMDKVITASNSIE
jgi:5-formyltetrahydrofolate cyclo-ligase